MKIKDNFIILVTALIIAFIMLAYLTLQNARSIRLFDQSFTTLIRQSYPMANQFFLSITQLANPVPMSISVTVSLIILIYKQYYVEAVWLLISMAIMVGAISPLMKFLFHRERPHLEHLVVETSFSFPSSHVLASMLFYGSLCYFLTFIVKNQLILAFLQVICVILISLIGASRVYLGVHYPSDVLGGYLLAIIWLLSTSPLYQQLRTFLQTITIQK